MAYVEFRNSVPTYGMDNVQNVKLSELGNGKGSELGNGQCSELGNGQHTVLEQTSLQCVQ